MGLLSINKDYSQRDSWPIAKNVKYRCANLQYVFPLMQRFVGEFVERNKGLPGLQRIVIFGSSVTWACNPWSDIDIFLEGVGEGTKLWYPRGPSYDILRSDTFEPGVAEPILDDILVKGVIVYERQRDENIA